jgi:hypothetical protein
VAAYRTFGSEFQHNLTETGYQKPVLIFRFYTLMRAVVETVNGTATLPGYLFCISACVKIVVVTESEMSVCQKTYINWLEAERFGPHAGMKNKGSNKARVRR